jgi:bleomycin hydrolase
MKKLCLNLLAVICITNAFAQKPATDKGSFREFKPGYYQNYILKGIQDFTEPVKVNTEKYFKLDVTGKTFPKDIKQYKTFWHGKPVSQGNTNTCWCFSSVSFFESEIARLNGTQVKLSEMYTVYWEYIEKARRFVREHGNSAVAEGSEGNAVTRMFKMYGTVPYEAYPGLKTGQKYLDHSKLIDEISNYLKHVKENSLWNEEVVLANVKSILNYYIGEPPVKVVVNNKTMTPVEYLNNELKLKMDDYVDVLSLSQQPFFKKVEYPVPDNWWHNADYYNFPLEDYMKILKKSIRSGYTVAIGGDVSESGFLPFEQVAMIPSYDIPAEYINDDSRQFRFSNGTTTDDHGMHLVGYSEQNGVDWYLVKDSGSGSRNVGEGSETFGYYFFREDYVKLKMMDFMVHKDMIADYLPKFK